MAIRVDVESVETFETTTKDGSKTFVKQPAWAHLYDAQGRPEPHPCRITLTLGMKGGKRPVREPYPVGKYVPARTSYRVKFGELALQYMELEPIAAEAKKSA